jgi:hypothetical protein
MSQTNPEVGVVQEMTTKAEPHKEHRWLQKLVGDWTYEVDAPGKPGEAPTRITGTESVRSLGELWIVAEGQGQTPGGHLEATRMTLGYDPLKRRVVGTWVGSMMTHQWVYDGELDAAGTALALNSEGPSMEDDGKTSEYQDVIEIKNDDHRLLTARVKGADGQWQSFMTVDYRRQR